MADLSPDSVNKLIHALNFVCRTVDQTQDIRLSLIGSLILDELQKVVAVRYEADTRQYRVTTGQGNAQNQTFRMLVKGDPKLAASVLDIIDDLPSEIATRALAHLSTRALNGELG